MARTRSRTVGRKPKPPLYDAVFADALQAAMTAVGIAGPTALAEAAGIGHAAASTYLLRQRLPDRATVPKLAAALRVDPDEIEGWIGATSRLDEDDRRVMTTPATESDSLIPDDSGRKRLIGEVALRLSRGDSTRSVAEWLQRFGERVDAAFSEGEGRDEGPPGGAEGAGDPA